MARQVNVYGVCDVAINLNSASPSWQDLGTTRDGVGVTSDGYFVEIKNDENGGEGGPPVEIQFMGETAKIRVELTKYDPAVAVLLEDHCQTADAGVPAAPGTLMFATSSAGQPNVGAGGACQVKLKCAQLATPIVRTYTLCVLRDAVEFNRGTKFSTFVLTFTAYKDTSLASSGNTGKLWVEAST